MKKVAFVCPFMLPVPAIKGGAIETLVTYLINENEKKKHFMFKIYTTGHDQSSKLISTYKNTKFDLHTPTNFDIKNHEYSIKFLSKLNITIPNRYFSYLSKKIHQEKEDIIIVQANHMCAYYLAKRFPNKKVYLHIHSNDFEEKSIYFKRVIEKVSNIIVVSDYLIKTALQSGYDIDKMVTLKNCTNNRIFNKELYHGCEVELRNSFNINENDFVILYTGRLIREKGVKELIKAIQLIPEQYSIKLLIVGSVSFGQEVELTDYEKEIQSLIQSLKNRVIMTGYIPNEDLPKIHSISDIQVIPYQWEAAAGLVVIEAMQSGVPVIVSDSGGIHEYINKDYCIEVKRGEDFCNNLAEKILYLYNNRELRAYNAKMSKIHAQRYSPEKYYEDFCKLIDGSTPKRRS